MTSQLKVLIALSSSDEPLDLSLLYCNTPSQGLTCRSTQTITRAFSARQHKLWMYSKTCVKQPLSKRPKSFQYQLLLNAGQKYCRMLPLEHSAILSTFIKLPFVIKIFVMSISEWPIYTGFTVDEVSDQHFRPLALQDMSALSF